MAVSISTQPFPLRLRCKNVYPKNEFSRKLSTGQGWVTLVATKISITTLSVVFLFSWPWPIITNSTVNRRVTMSCTRAVQWRRKLQITNWRAGVKCCLQATEFLITHQLIPIIELRLNVNRVIQPKRSGSVHASHHYSVKSLRLVWISLRLTWLNAPVKVF